MNYFLVLTGIILLIGLIFCSDSLAVEPKATEYQNFPVSYSQLPLNIAGISVTPHVYSREIRYNQPVSEELGSLVRLFIVHRDPSGKPVKLQLAFNGKKPSELLANGDWTWYEMPENMPDEGKPYILNPGRMDVFTFNTRRSSWGGDGKFILTLTDAEKGVSEDFNFIKSTDVQITSIVCLSEKDDSIYPDTLVVHLANNTGEPYQIKSLRIFTSATDGMEENSIVSKFKAFTKDGILPPHDRSGAWFYTGKLPLTHSALEIALKDSLGKEKSLWAHLRFKKDRFDIGSGWLEIPSRPGIVPVTKESYLKLLRRMHVNLAHIENVPGYTDSTGKDGLYTRYPLLMMSGFSDINRYNTDEWVAKIHGVDAVGEPQMGQKPEDTYKALRKYKNARYPTTLTLSQDSGFRYYAGLSDYPHFDAYRVTAPSADTWWLYDRWEGGPILWGAPLEGIGEMTRTLRSLSRPLPIALWSQSVSGGWEGGIGRKRRSPTPDEILMQAYQGLANGVISLYWYSLQTWSLLKYRDTIDTTTRIGREMRLLENLYLTGDAYQHERVNVDGKPNMDLSSIIAPDSAILFMLDLSYEPDRKALVFRFHGPRAVEASFQLPGYLRDLKDLFRVNADGIYNVKWNMTSKGVMIKDQLDRVGIYVAVTKKGMREELSKRLKNLTAEEESAGFDPARNDKDFAVLMHDLGFERIEDIGPEPGTKRPIQERSTIANPVYLALEPAINKELNLTEDQVDSIYQIAEQYQLSLLCEIRNMASAAERSADLSSEMRREMRRQSRERMMEITEKLLPLYRKQLNEILNSKQVERLNQITWQAMGIAAFKDTTVISALNLTREQQDKLSAIEKDYTQKRTALYGGGLSDDERRRASRELNVQQSEEAGQVLSDDQRKKFEEIKGKPFEM